MRPSPRAWPRYVHFVSIMLTADKYHRMQSVLALCITRYRVDFYQSSAFPKIGMAPSGVRCDGRWVWGRTASELHPL